MLPHAQAEASADSAAPQPTPFDHLVQRAFGWNKTRKEMIGSTGAEKERARSRHRISEQCLADAADRAERASGVQP